MKKVIAVLFSVLLVLPAFAEDNAVKTVEAFLADLDSSNSEDVINTAAEWLGKAKEKKAAAPLLKLLNDSRESVRIRSVLSLGEIGSDEAIDGINNALVNDSSSNVRYAAALASVQLASEKSVSAWKQASEKETDPFIRDFLLKMKEKVEK